MAGTVSVFDTTDWSPETTVTVGAGPYYVTPRPAGAEVWISNTSDGTITIIETSTNTVAGTITTGGAPRGIVFTADDSTAYVLNGGLGVVQIIDTTDRTFTAVGAGLTGFSNAGPLSRRVGAVHAVDQRRSHHRHRRERRQLRLQPPPAVGRHRTGDHLQP